MGVAGKTVGGSIRGAAAAQLGFDYQLDVSILAALQLLLISKAATRLILEPASEEDLEVDLEPNVPGRIESSATLAGGYKLVIQVKRDTGEPWSVDDFSALLKHGSDQPGGRRKALHHLDDPGTRYLLVTTADAKGVARGLLVEGFEEAHDRAKFPASLRTTLKKSPEGRVAIWGKLTEKQLASDLRELMSDLLHVPKVDQQALLEKLRAEAKRRTRTAQPGVWTREDLLATVRDHGGFLASLPSLEHFVPPANFDEMAQLLNEKNAVVVRGPSGTGKTQAALKLCDLARQRDGATEIVALGADDSPTSARKLVDKGPTLFYIDDPWGQYSLRSGHQDWTEQLPRMLAKASPTHRFVITSRSDMLRGAHVGAALDAWSVELDAEQYRGGQLRAIYDNRMDQLPPALQSKAYAFRSGVLGRLETPLEIDLYFSHLLAGPEPEEPDYQFSARLLALAQRDAVEGVVVKALEASDTTGTAAIVWALLAARGQFDRGQLAPLMRAIRPIDRDLADGLDKLIDRLVAARHLRQPVRTIAFAHPSVREGFEAFLLRHWLRSEAAIQALISALLNLPEPHRGWGMETAARVLETTRRFTDHSEIDAPLDIPAGDHAAIDAWLDEGLVDPKSDFGPLLELASEVGTQASIPSRVAFWLLKGIQRGGSVFVDDWKPPLFEDAWYDTVSADPCSAIVAGRFIRGQLAFDHGDYGKGFVERLDRIATGLEPDYLDAARQMVGNGVETNAEVVAAGALRDLEGFEAVVRLALDDLAALRRSYDQAHAEEWRAIEDGERDYAAEEAMQWNHEDDGYTSGVFVDAYVRRLRADGRWRTIAEHPRVAELVRAWAHAVLVARDKAPVEEIRALLAAAKDLDAEPEAWGAIDWHWHGEIEPDLRARLGDADADVSLRDALARVGLPHAPQALVATVELRAGRPDRQISLLTDIHRSSFRLEADDRQVMLKEVTDRLAPELSEILAAFPPGDGKAGAVGAIALAFLTGNIADLDPETLSSVAPVILASDGDASPAISMWLARATSKDHALAATKLAIEAGDDVIVERARRHSRADARRAALLHLAPSVPDPLPAPMLAMASDKSARVRRALVSVIAERPHPDHLRTLLGLIHDSWSSADHNHEDPVSYDVAQEAVIAIANNAPLSDATGDSLLDLAEKTPDRLLSQYALIAAAHGCGAGIQQKISNLVNVPGARWIRLDALDALAEAETLDPSITAHLQPSFLTRSGPILAVPAAHLVGAHAKPARALKLFERVASVNRRRVLLLVGANAMAERNRKTADQILDLLDPDHPARQLLASPEPLPPSILDDLGSVDLREYARKRLGKRIAEE
ncbi:hypothetical protein [Sphingobium sp.]|uniref:nSTAND3 domain-containing NTPase n=1 Tax=Sphingobium sp. TaxID=1912891 RepID=UPI002CD4E34E|nr:hypothetical protein [Sphingobium sp.]HUD90010.1 hypothetical protein [Sphingobium sp.]